MGWEQKRMGRGEVSFQPRSKLLALDSSTQRHGAAAQTHGHHGDGAFLQHSAPARLGSACSKPPSLSHGVTIELLMRTILAFVCMEQGKTPEPVSGV